MKTGAIVDHIVHWLRAYCDDAGLRGFVVGVSGGIDSAVTATLCAETGRPLRPVCLPIHQQPVQLSLARRHIAWLKRRYDNITSAETDLGPAFDALRRALPAGMDEDLMTMANTRSRLRMAALYAFAGYHQCLVAGTGNKIEDFGVGFFTKYGDGGVDLAPIADLMKSEVYRIGEYLGLLDAILAATPTDGLWPDNRSDEAQMGASYDELEWAMTHADTVHEKNLDDRQKKVLAIYRRLHRTNRHKMEPIPFPRIPAALKE